MISLIICSRKSDINPALKENIDTTIGVTYELVIIDNSASQYSIFQAYNLGVERSSYPLLCFMHDDIHYHTANWGQKVIAHFDDPKTGAIGVAGSPYAPKMPGSWWGGGLINEMLVHDAGPKAKIADEERCNRKPVVVLDGVWLVMRKSMFNIIQFDLTYTGFHFYDVDICLQVLTCGYKLYCIYDIWIQHFGSGNMNANWLKNALIFQKKWRKHLPTAVSALPYKIRMEAEYKTLTEYLRVMMANGTSKFAVGLFGLQHLVRKYTGYSFLALKLINKLTLTGR